MANGHLAIGISAQDAPSTTPLLAAVELALWKGGNLPREAAAAP
jgi:hypothetical protein